MKRGPLRKRIREFVESGGARALFEEFRRWGAEIAHGADPIEALHGHLCGPKCWHWGAMTEEEKERLRKAPWNQTQK